MLLDPPDSPPSTRTVAPPTDTARRLATWSPSSPRSREGSPRSTRSSAAAGAPPPRTCSTRTSRRSSRPDRRRRSNPSWPVSNVSGSERTDLAHVVVTHIHLDHAGGVWRIAERFPNATVWVHERGARHLADPTRLLASVTSIYGAETMASLFGPVEPVAAQRIRALGDGDLIELGRRHLETVSTPGHAKHHVALVDSATGAVFTGDALGIHPPDARVLRPATPPPDYDLELAIASIERIRERARGAMLLFSHFGPVEEVDRICDLAVERFRAWTDAVGEALERTEDTSTRSFECSGRSPARTPRPGPRPRSTCRPWRRCRASG